MSAIITKGKKWPRHEKPMISIVMFYFDSTFQRENVYMLHATT